MGVGLLTPGTEQYNCSIFLISLYNLRVSAGMAFCHLPYALGRDRTHSIDFEVYREDSTRYLSCLKIPQIVTEQKELKNGIILVRFIFRSLEKEHFISFVFLNLLRSKCYYTKEIVLPLYIVHVET